ncbi:MAG: hypothetical protein DDT32_02133 [Syntrophomonadaceae bacterium]|nr:hypothetical protein [Bacillota bacterium]MBT9160760.1 hypothetical protein [Chloroflexota bacterium]
MKVILDGVRFEQERITKNTVRFQEVVDPDSPNVVGSLYIQKWALGNPLPEAIKVTIEMET